MEVNEMRMLKRCFLSHFSLLPTLLQPVLWFGMLASYIFYPWITMLFCTSQGSDNRKTLRMLQRENEVREMERGSERKEYFPVLLWSYLKPFLSGSSLDFRCLSSLFLLKLDFFHTIYSDFCIPFNS